MNPNNSNYELTGKVIGCAMEVHRVLGRGFQEVIYQRALSYELELNRISHVREFVMDIIYKDRYMGHRRVDFLVEGFLSVEIKAVSELLPEHFVQGMNYLEIYNLEIGLLINFGSKSLEFKRLHNNRRSYP